jgi:DNA-binding response OmpR family regulator
MIEAGDPNASDLTLLIVEDEPAAMELAIQSLQGMATTFLRAADGAEGLRLFREEQPHAIILDIHLPGVNGFSLLEAIRRESDVPVLMVTGAAAREDQTRGWTLGADQYITKPYSPKELRARLQAVLRRAYPSRFPDQPDRR